MHARPRSTCHCRSRRRAPTSRPWPMCRSTPSTARRLLAEHPAWPGTRPAGREWRGPALSASRELPAAAEPRCRRRQAVAAAAVLGAAVDCVRAARGEGGIRRRIAGTPARLPGISGSGVRRRAARARDGSRAGRACRDGAASPKTSRLGPASTIAPAYITSDAVGACSATTPRSCVMRIIAMPSRACEVGAARGSAPGSSRRARWSARRRSGGRARRRAPSRSSRAGACRRRAGAGSRRNRASGSGMPTCAAARSRAARASAPAQRRDAPERLGDLLADRHHRVQRRQRVLEDHRDARRRAPRAAAPRRGREVLAPKRIAPPSASPPGRRGRPQQRERRHRSCREPDSPTTPAFRRSTRSRRRRRTGLPARRGVELDESGRPRAASGGSSAVAAERGLSASFRPSPTRLIASTVRKIARPGMAQITRRAQRLCGRADHRPQLISSGRRGRGRRGRPRSGSPGDHERGDDDERRRRSAGSAEDDARRRSCRWRAGGRSRARAA